jgi:hypothetical protein
MRRLMAVLIVFSAVLLPLAAHAQQPGSRSPLPGEPPVQTTSVDGTKILVVGAGAVIGAAIFGMPMRAATLVGAVAGGLLAAWWYGDQTSPLTIDATRKGL